MKRLIIFEILRKLKSRPAVMRKVKIIAFISLFGFMFIGGIAIWAGVSAFRYIVATANQAGLSPQIVNQVQIMKSELKQIQLQPLSCWNKAQSLLAVQPWLEKPVLYNLRNLKVACLDAMPPVCEGDDCNQMKKIMTTAKGGSL